MLVAQRRELLLDRLAREGRVVARDVAEEFGLSEDTVRRDLRDLAAAGLCQRVYGGAVPLSPAAVDSRARADVEPQSKQLIARQAARLITEGSTVILDGGTTTVAVARTLPRSLECTVITLSPAIAVALLEHRAEVILIGGRLSKHSAVTSGAAAAEALRGVSADLFLLGVTGVHPTAGLTTGDAEDAAMKRLQVGRAAETYVLASREKIGTASRFQVVEFEAVTAVIADPASAAAPLADLRAAGVTVILAD